MRILMIGKYPPIQGGVSADTYWTAQVFAELGHHVTVLTNADEVEPAYRITLNEEDMPLLCGYRLQNAITVVSTHADRRHVYVPANNPTISKLVGIGLRLIEEVKPDVIWSYYLEPYGVAALMLSMMTGVPYTVRHAGSDIGRLMQTPQLECLYREVFRKAMFVFSRSVHHSYLIERNVAPDCIMEPKTPRLPGDVFYPTTNGELPSEHGVILGIYGKVGPMKGTQALLDALVRLRKEGVNLSIHALWGGRGLPEVLQQAEDHGLTKEVDGKSMLTVRHFIPHWRVPSFIRSCHGMLFLENRFRVQFHTPGIPLEVNSCGRMLLTTREVVEKPNVQPLLQDGTTIMVVPQSTNGAINGESLAEAMRAFADRVRETPCLPPEMCFDASLYSAWVRNEVALQLNKIQERL